MKYVVSWSLFIYKKHNSYYLIGIHKDNFILSDNETLL